MSSALEIDGRELYPIKEAAKLTSYSRDYVTRLAREERISASYIGRQWFVDLDSLQQYADLAAKEQEVHKKKLSDERKRERQMRTAVEAQQVVREKRARTLHVRSVVTASFVLGAGLFSGLTIYTLLGTAASYVSTEQPAVQQAQVTPSTPTRQSAAAQVSQQESESAKPPAVAAAGTSPRELRPLRGAENGILLLPQGAPTSSTAALFSDEVAVEVLPDGRRAVVRLNATGEPVGEPVPFVSVPVTQ